MQIYQSRHPKLTGSSYLELERKARKLHNEVAKRTKRNAYVRSTYFKGEKVFIKLFWEHLSQKYRPDRERRLVYYHAALDLLRNTTYQPEIKRDPRSAHNALYRFAGRSKDGLLFYVQVKEDKRHNKYFMSVFDRK